jgi:hypothetical protein
MDGQLKERNWMGCPDAVQRFDVVAFCLKVLDARL